MEYSGYLATMAQVAGVLVGFANLANAINRPGISAPDMKLNKLRIVLTTEMGLLLICSCVIPLLMTTSNFSEENIFKGSSLFMSVVGLLYNLYISRRAKAWTGRALPVTASVYYHLAGLFLVNGPLMLNGFGLFGDDRVIFMYYLVTFVLFILLCTLFCRLLYSVLPTTVND